MTKTKRTYRPEREPETSAAAPPSRLLTVLEAADVLSISTAKLSALTKEGQIPAVKLGRARRYDPADLRDLIDRSKAQK